MIRILYILVFLLVHSGHFYANEISYAFSEDCTKFDLSSTKLIPVNNQLINQGVTNGCVDLIITIDKNATEQIIKLPYIRHEHISSEIIQGDATIRHLPQERYRTYHIRGEEGSIAHIRLKPTLCAFVPIQTFTAQEFAHSEKKNLLGIGLYFGFVVAMFLLNVILSFYFKDRIFLVYGFILIFISTNIWYEDGMMNLLGMASGTSRIIDSIAHWMVPVLFAVLTWDYLQFKEYFPKIKYLLTPVIAVTTICYVMYHISDNNWYGAAGDISAIITLLLIYLSSILLFKKSEFAKIIVIAYSFILLCTVDIYIPKIFGTTMLDVSHAQVKLGGLIEMVVVLFALIYRMNRLREENEYHKVEIKRMMEELDHSSSKSQSLEEKISNLGLTGRQVQILNFIRTGKTNKEIALEMNISVNTVKFHVKNIYEKLGIHSRNEIISAEMS